MASTVQLKGRICFYVLKTDHNVPKLTERGQLSVTEAGDSPVKRLGGSFGNMLSDELAIQVQEVITNSRILSLSIDHDVDYY
jgi:hypothetical protein